MKTPSNKFEDQVIQIASLGVWAIITGKQMTQKMEQCSDPRWDKKTGLFITLRKDGEIRGSMGMLESSMTLPEALFEISGTAASHDERFPPLEESELKDVSLEVTLLSEFEKLQNEKDVRIGETGLLVSREDKQGVLLPKVAKEYSFSSEQFLEATCEKAGLSHKAWKDSNTLVETFTCESYAGKTILEEVSPFV